ncbi:proteasome assembly chaperone family protein [Pseudoclavibacter helvolus]|uniref:proteasome assembly chaperone family protein n=1 Tax=Pseudoclavibacter helvolus TaxID=255205 RepID=UPI003C745774
MTEHSEATTPFARGRLLVVALLGWNDAGDAASTAVRALQEAIGADRLIEDIDDESFFDYSIHRPVMRAGTEGIRKIHWPSVSFKGTPLRDATAEAAPEGSKELAADAGLSVSSDNGDNVFVLIGPEPTLRWRSFTKHVVDLCEREDITRIVLVGALLADVPHTRPITIFMSSDDEAVREELDIDRSEYEGPTGVLSAIGEEARSRGMLVLSLWASVPHYAHHSPSPKATLALVDRLTEIVDVSIPHGDLVSESAEWESEVTEATAQDEEIAQYVGYLERTRDMVEAPEASGEAIAQEFERFLEQAEGKKPQPGPASFPTDPSGTAQRPMGVERRSSAEDGAVDDAPDQPSSGGEQLSAGNDDAVGDNDASGDNGTDGPDKRRDDQG